MFDLIAGGDIRIPKMAEVIAARLRKAIVRGDIRIGDKLPSEARLISDFDVSRPTIREALRILEFEGLIVVSRGARGGARVTDPSDDMVTRAAGLALQLKGATIADIYEARSAIEPSAAKIAAETGGVGVVDALRRQLQFEREISLDRAQQAKGVADFHRILMERCGNVALGVVGFALHDVVERHMQLSYRNQPPTDVKLRNIGLRSQERLIDLIEAEDGAEAEAHWIRHMNAASESWLEGFRGTSVVDILEWFPL
jgi:DNA-binding FadR family transcriptional regulator